ncbi:PREDICTED: circadian clock-controlled protein-like [Polistes dominula]|uniref:Circadian clock-controlled protein-like n=1 Tax=Polistes dominula TaxID=743375 RepID=A0ABM1I186_POLDO|nr:PREDICTED: circadian clock-controlled protein-like [Polistes dominula]
MKCYVLFIFNLILFSMIFDVGQSKDIPDFIHVCKRNDPNIVPCVTESVESLKPYLQKGVPEYNIPSLEPLLLKNLIATERAGLRISAKDVEAYGASDFTITDLKTNFDKLEFDLKIKLPHLHIKGNYDINGRVLLLPIQGSGPMNGNFTQCTGSVKVRAGSTEEPNGDHRLFIEDFQMKITVGKGTLNLDNLFGGEKVLGDVINNAINSNFDAFLGEMQPLIEKALSDAFREIANGIISNFTYEQLFPLN